MTGSKRFYIGTSGWSYSHWKGPFYPEDIKNDALLDYYVRHFSTVEINNSFYHLPAEHTMEHWRDCTPKGFRFAVKASRYITHIKKLKDPEKTLPPFLDRVQWLGHKLGPILFQLPPKWHINVDRLAEFLQALDKRYRYTMEFRDTSWFDDRVYDLLHEHNIAFCLYDLDGVQSPKEVTADFVYVRLHGPDGPYQGQYNQQTLNGWAGAFSTWMSRGKAVYCYFDNDEAGYAAKDAARLQSMLAHRPQLVSS